MSFTGGYTNFGGFQQSPGTFQQASGTFGQGFQQPPGMYGVSQEQEPYEHSEENMKKKFLDYYSSLMGKNSYPVGWKDKIIAPKHASPGYIHRIVSYIVLGHYGNNGFESSNWDQDIFCVINGTKPISLTENDYTYPFRIPAGADMTFMPEKLDLELRYIGMRYLGLKGLITDTGYDPAVIWYKDENWPSAIYYYLFERRLAPDNKFTGSILLGYGYQSTLINNVDYGFKRQIISYLSGSANISFETLEKIIDALPAEQLYDIYEKWYVEYKKIADDPEYSRREYDTEKARINRNLKTISENPLFAAYAQANSIEDNLKREAMKLFGK